jgi:hypothetical protein
VTEDSPLSDLHQEQAPRPPVEESRQSDTAALNRYEVLRTKQRTAEEEVEFLGLAVQFGTY